MTYVIKKTGDAHSRERKDAAEGSRARRESFAGETHLA